MSKTTKNEKSIEPKSIDPTPATHKTHAQLTIEELATIGINLTEDQLTVVTSCYAKHHSEYLASIKNARNMLECAIEAMRKESELFPDCYICGFNCKEIVEIIKKHTDYKFGEGKTPEQTLNTKFIQYFKKHSTNGDGETIKTEECEVIKCRIKGRFIVNRNYKPVIETPAT